MKNIQKILRQFRDDRQWQGFHTPRNLILALMGEVGELAEIYQWDLVMADRRRRTEEEIADIMIYALNICNALGIDAESAIMNKIEKNSQKYPIEEGGYDG